MFRRFAEKVSVYPRRSHGRQFSADVNGGAGEKSLLGRAVAFTSRNRQQLINIFAMYLVVSFGVHNFKVQKAWEERELQVKQLNATYSTIKDELLDPTWLGDLENKVRSTKAGQSVLLAAVQEKLANFNPDKPDDSVSPAATAKPSASVVAAPVVGVAPVGISVNGSSTGKVI